MRSVRSVNAYLPRRNRQRSPRERGVRMPITTNVHSDRRRLRRMLTLPAVALVLMIGNVGSPARVLATPPGKNGLIAFSAAAEAGTQQLFTMRPNGKDLRQITHVDGDAVNVDWSP